MSKASPSSPPGSAAPHRTGSLGEALGRLQSMSFDGQSVLSLYLDFDPARFPSLRERRAQVDGLLCRVDRESRDAEGATRAERMARRDDLDRVRALLSDEELTPQRARGLAVFSCAPARALEVVRLPRAVEPQVSVESAPHVEPLVELLAPERWGVLLISRRAARILRGTRERLSEVAEVTDEVHRRHSQGGWSQARYQRGIEHEVDDHIRGAAAMLLRRYGAWGFDRLLIGAHSELQSRVEQALHPELARLLAGRFEVDVERAGPDQVRRLALPLIEADEQRREREALELLGDGLAHGARAAAGLDEVLDLLSEGRVQTLILAAGHSAPGYACPHCDRLASTAGRCPADGAPRVPRKDVIESAVELALNRSAGVMIVRHEAEAFLEHGPVAALLRY